MMHKHRVVIVGGGFAGVALARRLRRDPVDVTIVDRRNFHLFQPLLYQVATGGLSPADIASPLRNVFKRQDNVTVLLGEAFDLEPDARRLLLADGEIDYDTLVVATGSAHHYFGHDEWLALAPPLKTIEDATEIRGRVFSAFERAERASDPEQRAALLTFVIVGAGPTGVELAGALAEIARDTLAHEFRTIDPAAARIVLVEGADRVLPGFHPQLSARASAPLDRLGVVTRLETLVARIEPGVVTLAHGGVVERLASHTVLWAAGVTGSAFAGVLSRRVHAKLDAQGRVEVEDDLSLAAHPEILVVGDLAHVGDARGQGLPGIAPVAIQQGAFAAGVIRDRIAGRRSRRFRYRDWGLMATVGRHAAVADLLGVRVSGLLAWIVWLFVHLMKIVEFENRLLVLVQWAWNYVTYNRAARLITGTPWWVRSTAAAPAAGRRGPGGPGHRHDGDGVRRDRPAAS